MTTLNRRSLLMGSMGALAVGTLLAGCTTATVGTTTTLTINVAKISAYVTAGLNAATTVETALATLPTMAPYVAVMQSATALLRTASNAFTAAVGDKVSVSYDDASVKTLIDSILSAISQIADQISVIIAALIKAGFSISDSVTNHIQVVHDAIVTIVSVFKALLVSSLSQADAPVMLGAKPVVLAMTEDHALRTLGA